MQAPKYIHEATFAFILWKTVSEYNTLICTFRLMLKFSLVLPLCCLDAIRITSPITIPIIIIPMPLSLFLLFVFSLLSLFEWLPFISPCIFLLQIYQIIGETRPCFCGVSVALSRSKRVMNFITLVSQVHGYIGQV